MGKFEGQKQSSEAIDSAKMKDDTEPSKRTFTLNLADVDNVVTGDASEKAQNKKSEEFLAFSHSHVDALWNNDNDNINFLADDSDRGYNGGQKESKEMPKRWKGKGKMEDDEEWKTVKTMDMRKGKGGEKAEEEKREAPKLFQNLANDSTNAQTNDVNPDEGAKEKGGFRKLSRRFDIKKKDVVKSERSKATVSQSAVDNGGKPDRNGNNSHKEAHKKKSLFDRLSFTGGKKNKVTEEKEFVPFPRFSESSADTEKEVDDDNIESEEEEDEKEKFWYKIPRFGGQKNKLANPEDTCEIFPHFDPTASGNVPGIKVSKFRENMKSFNENGTRGGKVNLWREERRAIKLMEGKKAVSDSALMDGAKMWDGAPLVVNDHRRSMSNTGISHGSQKPSVSSAITHGDSNFHTRTIYSAENAGKIISSYPETATINVIEAMYVAPPDQSNNSTPGLRLGKVVPTLLKRGWSWNKDEAEVKEQKKPRDKTKEKKVRKSSEESLDALIQHIKNKFLKKVEDVERNANGIVLHTTNKGTKDLERQVYEVTQSVGKAQGSFVTRSNSIRSVVPIIEDNSINPTSIEGGQETENELERKAHMPEAPPEDASKDFPQRCQFMEPSNEPNSSTFPSIQNTIHQ